VGWGGLTTIADTIKEIQLVSQDQLDPINGEDWTPGASSLVGIAHFWDDLIYDKGVRTINMAQNTGAANNIGYYMDNYPDPTKSPNMNIPQYGRQSANGFYSTTYGGALTAITWKQQAFAPTKPIPAGRYAIKGVTVSALTNYALIRFRHADFGAFAPGFPVLDLTNTALANAVAPKDPLLLNQNLQFCYLSDILNKPMCPTFTVSNQGTGLQFEMASITADTPIVELSLSKVG